MIMTLPDVKGNLYDVSFEDVMKIYNIEKAVIFEVNE